MDINKVGEKTLTLIENVGSFISEERKTFSKNSVESKGMHDFVSYVDKEAEKKLVAGLKEIIPEAGFITEENTATHSKEDYIWIIDPLDGTTNYIHNLTPHAISVALQFKHEMVLGVVYELGAKEMYYSWTGKAVFCNNEEIKVSSAESLSECLVATGFHTNNFDRLPQQLNIVDKVVRGSHGLRRHGSAATDLAYVAAGKFGVFFEHGLSAWDVAAGTFLVKQAGGFVSDYKGEQNYLFGREMIAGAKGVHEEMLAIIQSEMEK